MKRIALATAAAAALVAVSQVTAARDYTVVARITRYVDTGMTYGGTWTTLGRTAGCSWDIPLFSVVVMSDGRAFVCEDRGVDDGVERVDLYDPWGVVDSYPDWDVVTIYP